MTRPQRHRWMDRMRKSLRPYEHMGELVVFSDRNVDHGDAWDACLKEQLRTASVVIVLVSDSLLASDYVRSSELPLILEREARGDLKLISVVLNSCDFDQISFKFPDWEAGPREARLSSFQSGARTDMPLNRMSPGEQDEVLTSVAKAVRKHALQRRRQNQPATLAAPLQPARPEPVVSPPLPAVVPTPRPAGAAPAVVTERDGPRTIFPSIPAHGSNDEAPAPRDGRWFQLAAVGKILKNRASPGCSLQIVLTIAILLGFTSLIVYRPNPSMRHANGLTNLDGACP